MQSVINGCSEIETLCGLLLKGISAGMTIAFGEQNVA
jgi:hypothetical protein